MRCCKLYLVFLFLSGNIFSQSYNFKNYSVEHGLTYIHIYDIFQDDKGYLWTGGYGGLSSFDGLKFTNFSPGNGLIHYSVQAITQDKDKNIVVGTIEGLSVYNGKKFTNYTRKDGLSNVHINSLATQDNKVAIGTEEGLFYLMDKKITAEQNLKNESIEKLKNYKGKIYGITKNNIFTVDNGKYTSLFSFLKNSDTLITAFEFDKSAVLWIGTNKGLFKINKKT